MYTLTWRLKFFITVLLLIFAVNIPGVANADVNDFDVTEFSVDYYLDKSKPHGHMRVNEKISVFFRDNNHGILRALPQSYNGHALKPTVTSVKNNDGSSWPYTTYEQSGNLVLKIGDSDKTVTGAQQFNVTYTVDNTITFYDDHDELFWDVNGDQWQQPFLNVNARLHLGESISLKEPGGSGALTCFTGRFGATGRDCEITPPNSGTGPITFATTRTLQSNETLSLAAAFPKGTFTPYSWRDTVKEYADDIILSVLTLGLLVAAIHYFWRKGKDYKARGSAIPEYQPPKNVDALTAGILDDYRLDMKDVTAAIIELAVKGHLKIIETDSRKLGIFKNTKTELELVNTNTKNLNAHQKELLKALFPNMASGEKISLDAYNSRLQKAMQSIGKSLSEQMTVEGHFEANPQKAGARMWWFLGGLFVILALGFIFQAFISVGLTVLALVISFILLAKMPRRSRAGQQTHQDLQGLKLYLKTAEKDRIRQLQGPSAPLAANAHEPVRTVELFEKLLPFAIVLGVEKDWAKQFKDLYTTPPDWYRGNWSTFSTVALVNSINSTSSAVATSFAAPSSSGSSGFSGGGAGGGGGGGGGGGW